MAPPFVSVIVPVRNEARTVEACLYSIAAQTYPRDRLEVLVVDGMSDDGTPQIVSRFAAESTVDARLLRNPRRLPAAAMNLALDAARGDIIVRLDGHAAAAPDFLARSVALLEDSGADCAGGVIESVGDTPAGEAIALAMASRFGVGGARFRTGGEAGPADTVAFGAYRRDVFARIGRFAEDIEGGEDDEFNYRLLDAGGRIVLDPAIRSRYLVRGDLRSLWRQYFRYGRAKPEVLRRHPAQARLRQLAPPAFVLALGAGAVIAPRAGLAPLRALAAAYAVAAAGASLLAALPAGKPRALPRLPAAFACMHVAYGLGFWAGAGDALRRAVLARVVRRAEAPALRDVAE
jgi:succinoglycan biosynthesis protein ExoA